MKVLKICEFSKYPGPRFSAMGSSSGEQFRDEILIPALLENNEVTIDFDNVVSYGSLFLEEIFGGVVRKIKNKECALTVDCIKKLRENFISLDDPSIVTEAKEYIDEALRQCFSFKELIVVENCNCCPHRGYDINYSRTGNMCGVSDICRIASPEAAKTTFLENCKNLTHSCPKIKTTT